MPTATATVDADQTTCPALCDVCHCSSEGCDGTVCHGLDAD